MLTQHGFSQQNRVINWGHPSTLGLKLCLVFDQGSDKFVSYTGENLIATYNGTPSYLDGRRAFVPASTNYASISSPTALNDWSLQSVECWFRFDPSVSMVQFTRFFEKGINNEWTIAINYVAGTNKITVQVMGDTGEALTTTQAFNDNKWHHLVVTFNSLNIVAGEIFLYVDGILDKSTVGGGGSPDAKTGDFFIGTAGTGFVGTFLYHGAIELVRVYNRVLFPTEVAELYINPYGMFSTRKAVNVAEVAGSVTKPYYYAMSQGLN